MRTVHEGSSPRFGIGEWFGHLLSELSSGDRRRFDDLRTRGGNERPGCPFKPAIGGAFQPCTKAGGVCSLKLYRLGDNGRGIPAAPPDGDLRILCPYRFREGLVLEQWIGETLLGTASPLSIGEVRFLKSTVVSEGENPSDVGRIDQVLMHPDLDRFDWCAVELQAVYFSGSEMAAEFSLARDFAHEGAPFPAKTRRPDYRSSGPKRLMPQLQIKVPTLRRWGKRMAVVIDEPFFRELGKMDDVPHPSNADIAWFVVRLREEGSRAVLEPAFVRFTTLERAVEGLTAGIAVSLPEFEQRIRQKLDRQTRVGEVLDTPVE